MKFVISRAINSPCLNCADRYIGCHACCEKDKAYHEKLYNAKRTIYAQKRAERIVNDYVVNAKVKMANLRGVKTNGKCRYKIWERRNMTDCEKIALVKHIMANAFEYYDNENATAMYVVLDVVSEILNFGGVPDEADSIAR